MLMMLFQSFLPNTSYACDCSKPDNVTEEVDRHTAVFSGKVIEMVDKNAGSQMQSSADLIAVLFEVEESWKGINQTQVIVYTERSSASCGYEFSLENKYLVYAKDIDGELKVSNCSRTTPLSFADEDIAELGKGEKPTEQVALSIDDQTPPYMLIYIISIVGLLLLVSAFLIRRYKKSSKLE